MLDKDLKLVKEIYIDIYKKYIQLIYTKEYNLII